MPWQAYLDGAPFLNPRSKRQTAMNLVDKPYQRGRAEVRDTVSGAVWQRRGGSWFPGDTAARAPAKAVR